MKRAVIQRLLERNDRGISMVLVTNLVTGDQQLLTMRTAMPDGSATDLLSRAVRQALAADRSMTIDLDGHRQFLLVLAPPIRVVIVGGGEIGQQLAGMVRMSGYEPVVVDPRPAFAKAERFPATTVLQAWPDCAVETLGLDSRTAVVTLTHDPKLDDPALQAALASDAFYIGALGSRRTQLLRRERLIAAGVPSTALDRIHGPVGLAIGARTPGEIAVAILAQLVAVLRQGTG